MEPGAAEARIQRQGPTNAQAMPMKHGYVIVKDRVGGVTDPVFKSWYLRIFMCAHAQEKVCWTGMVSGCLAIQSVPSFTFCFIFAMNLNYSNNQEGKCY